MATIADIRSRVATRIKDTAASLDPTTSTRAIDEAIVSAVEEYGKSRPLSLAVAVTGDGTFKYSLTAASPVLAGFVDGFSTIRSLVYPYDATSQDLTELEEDDWTIRRLADGLWLWFTVASPASSESFLAEYTVPHTCSEASLTVPSGDYEAVADLSASHALLILANAYIQSIDASISADAVNRATKPDLYRQMAASFRKAYELKMSGGAATGPALLVSDLDRADGAGGDYLFHGRRRF